MTTIILASNNAGKLQELQTLCQAHKMDVTFVAQGALGIQDASEDGQSFIENAIIKARHASAHGDLPALADDSGLCVPILNHAPGIYSARYAGEHGNDTANNNKLLQALLPFRDEPISAYFVCVLAFVRHKDDPLPLIAVGRWQGEIHHTPKARADLAMTLFFGCHSLTKLSPSLTKQPKTRCRTARVPCSSSCHCYSPRFVNEGDKPASLVGFGVWRFGIFCCVFFDLALY